MSGGKDGGGDAGKIGAFVVGIVCRVVFEKGVLIGRSYAS
jgi:hypothetical protein